MRRSARADNRWLALVALAGGSGVAWAEEEPEVIDAALDMEFLEYLGSWDASDEEWMLFAGEEDAPAPRTDPAPEGEESVESNDEE